MAQRAGQTDQLVWWFALSQYQVCGYHEWSILVQVAGLHATSISTFKGEDTSEGGRLMQASGMQVAYNTWLTESRLLSVDMWDKETKQYNPWIN
jgi:hypothetical protein